MNRLFKNKNFLLLWIGQAVSSAGTWINFVGLNAYVYHVFGSGRILGLFLLIRLLPALLFGSLGGIIADRLDRRKILIVCDFIRGFLVLAFLSTDNLYLYFLIGFLLSALDKVFTASLGALLPDLVERDALMEANSLKRMSQSLVTVLGPALAGLLIGLWGYKVVFIIDSGTFFFSVLTLLLVISPEPLAVKRLTPEGIREELRVTMRFITGSAIFFLFMLLRVVDGLGSGTYNTALPVFASGVAKSFYGYLVASWGCGTFLGSLLVGILQKTYKFKIESLFCGSMLLMALGMGGTFNVQQWIPSLVLIFIGGLGDGVSGVIFTTMMMEEPPREIRGKVFGSVSAIFYMAAGFGMLIGGILIDHFKYSGVTNAGSLFIAISTVVVWGILARNKSGQVVK